MSKIPSPSEIYNTKQPISTDTLVRWAKDAGFNIRRPRGGSSHIIYRHSIHRDIGSSFIVNSHQMGSQRSFADCLVEIEKRELSLQAKFQEAATNKILNFYANLPPHISAEHDFEKGHTILRDRQLPQLGVTIPFAEARLAENKVRFMDSIKREAFILLSRAKMEYDVQTSLPRGKFDGILSHSIYGLEPKVIEDYEAGDNPSKILLGINDFICAVMEQDDAHDKKLDALLAHDFVGATKVAFHARRGERTNAVRLERPDGRTFSLIFETASNRRAEVGDIHRGRIAEAELARVEKTIQALAKAHSQAQEAVLKIA